MKEIMWKKNWQFWLFFTVVSTRILLFESEVIWTIETHPIVMYKNVTLICKVTGACCQQYTRQFHGGEKNYLLTSNEKSSDISKYDSRLKNNGFTLVIQNFNFDDAGKHYACSYGFEQYRTILELGSNYEIHPRNDTTNVYFNISKLSIDLEVYLTEVYPKPECNATFNEEDFSRFLITHPEEKGKYFSTNLSFHYAIKEDICKGVFFLICKIGTSRIPIIEETMKNTSNCTDTMDDSVSYVGVNVTIENINQWSPPKTAAVAIVAVFTFTIAIVIVFYICKKHRQQNTASIVVYKAEKDTGQRAETSPGQEDEQNVLLHEKT